MTIKEAEDTPTAMAGARARAGRRQRGQSRGAPGSHPRTTRPLPGARHTDRKGRGTAP